MSCGAEAQRRSGRVALWVALATSASAFGCGGGLATSGDAGDASEVSTDAANTGASNGDDATAEASAPASMMDASTTEAAAASSPSDTMTEATPDSGSADAASEPISDAASGASTRDASDGGATGNVDAETHSPHDAAVADTGSGPATHDAAAGAPCSSTQCSLDGTSMNICNQGTCQPCTSDEQCLLSYGEIDYICSGGSCGNF